jgi:transposase
MSFKPTKTCSACGNTREAGLGKRVYTCQRCGKVIDRDLNSSIDIWDEDLRKLGVVCTEFTPVEIGASTSALEYLNSIPYVEASLIHETGSPPA